MSRTLPAALAARVAAIDPPAVCLRSPLQVLAPALRTYHLAQIALGALGFAAATGMALHWAVLGGCTLLMLAAAWITFVRSDAKA